MPQTLITTIAASFGLALIMGLIASRLKLPPLVGYLMAGILLGPAVPGFVDDPAVSGQLAEIGLILLMFGVGLHVSLGDMLQVKRIAIPGALVHIIVATAMGMGTAFLWGWSIGASLLFGLALSVASTVVLVRALEQRGLVRTINGRIAIGWLTMEDLAMVLVLVLLPPLAGTLGGGPNGFPAEENGPGILTVLVIAFGKIAIFLVIMMAIASRLFPRLLRYVAGSSRELVQLSIVAVALGIAYASAWLFGVSFALGAFFSGMLIRESPLSHRAAKEALPLRGVFSVLFFVSVGMLFDPDVLIQLPLQVLAVVAIIVLGKSLASFLLVLAFRFPLNTALTVSASLAQIGEFSFILTGIGVSLGLLPQEGISLIVAGALISISINQFVFRAIEPAQAWIRGHSRLARALERSDDLLARLPTTVLSRDLANHVVLVGYGRVGQRIGDALVVQNLPFVVAEQNRELVETLRETAIYAVAGDASDAAVLGEARITRARMLVITTPDMLRVRRMIEIALRQNPKIGILVRAFSDSEAEMLRNEISGAVFLGEQELALSMTSHILSTSEE